mgnify:CR=1 FL=1
MQKTNKRFPLHYQGIDGRTHMQIPFFMIKQSNDMISLIDGHDQRL